MRKNTLLNVEKNKYEDLPVRTRVKIYMLMDIYNRRRIEEGGRGRVIRAEEERVRGRRERRKRRLERNKVYNEMNG
jgi:hypothetical protein